MIDYETYLQIKICRERHGLTPPQIARKLSLDERTVEKWLLLPRFAQQHRSGRKSKIDPFKAQVVQWLESHPYTAVQIMQRLVEQGYDGGYSIVKDYVRKIRPKKNKAFLSLFFAPGECAQVDWGSFGTVPVGNTTRRLSFFVMVLCYSRRMYVEFTVCQSLEHFLACHQNAFEYFGAVPRRIMVDNLKSAVLKHALGQAPVLNPKYLDFANHHGFGISPCAVGRGNEKGRVESGVGYVKKNFLSGLSISDFKLINPAGRIWLNTVANVRVHAQTGQKPIHRFNEEKSALLPLPAAPYDAANIATVRACRQFRVTLDTNRYSVPAEYAGQLVTLKSYPDRICVYDQQKLIARHVRSYERRMDFELPDHVRPLLAERKKARDQKIFMTFLNLSAKAHDYFEQLGQRRLNPMHHVRKIVALSEIHGADAVARAMDDAFYFAAFSCEYIANLLEQRARSRPVPSALMLTRRQDLLELTVEKPDLTIYNLGLKEKANDNYQPE
jgi:transposase